MNFGSFSKEMVKNLIKMIRYVSFGAKFLCLKGYSTLNAIARFLNNLKANFK